MTDARRNKRSMSHDILLHLQRAY